LKAFVNINPVSHVVTAVRDLMNNGQVTAEVGWALLGCAAIVAIFAPLAVRTYSRKM
jgi:ABC-2 type transport system permease protein